MQPYARLIPPHDCFFWGVEGPGPERHSGAVQLTLVWNSQSISEATPKAQELIRSLSQVCSEASIDDGVFINRNSPQKVLICSFDRVVAQLGTLQNILRAKSIAKSCNPGPPEQLAGI